MRVTLLLLSVVRAFDRFGRADKHSRGHRHSSHAELVPGCEEQ